MSKINGYRYCNRCKNRLVKNGHNRNGRQIWKCKNCISFAQLPKPDATKKQQLLLFINWLLNKQTIAQATGRSRQTFYNQTNWCWNVKPKLTLRKECLYLMVDAVYIKRQIVCIVLRNDKYVVDYEWCQSENYQAYSNLFSRNIAPKFLITDGNANCIKASQKHWNDAKIQRCIFHILLSVKSKLSANPKTDAGIKLLKWTENLMYTNDQNKALKQLIKFKVWEEDFMDFLKEKTYFIESKTGKRR